MTRSLRDLAWAMSAPLRWVLIAAIRIYRATLAGWLGGQCRFYPSCSRYAEAAIREHGAVRGSAMAAWRVLRCNPFGAGGPDPVPAGKRYVDVTRRPPLPGRSEGLGRAR
jgi:putative membrane protein insertion efficiency factor